MIDLAEVWNAGAVGRHAFYPWTAPMLEGHLQPSHGWSADDLLLALENNRLAGWAQATILNQGHMGMSLHPAGSIEMLVVTPQARGRGVGRALLRAALAHFRQRGMTEARASGAWPYGPHFHALADGSERSGVPADDPRALACLSAAGFTAIRRSWVMRFDMNGQAAALIHNMDGEGLVSDQARMGATWLDYAFRAWTLREQHLPGDRGETLSQAIYARMDGLSDYDGKEYYALFGVYTTPGGRRQGHARRNLTALLSRLRSKGAAFVELHCYADNIPALGLYRELGFREVVSTTDFRLVF